MAACSRDREGRKAARLTAAIDLPVTHGLWIAARAKAGTAQVAHTTPVYVTANGEGFQNPETLDDRLATAERYLVELEPALQATPTSIDEQAGRHRAQLERQIVEARATLASTRAAR